MVLHDASIQITVLRFAILPPKAENFVPKMSREIADFRSISADVTIVTNVTNTLFRRRSGRGDRLG